MPFRTRWFAGWAGALALAGCGARQSVDDAKAQVSVFHDDLNRGEYDLIWKETAPAFKQATPSADFENLLAAVARKLGKVKSSEQVGWEVKATTNGKLTVLVMDTEFERGSGRETFTYVRNGDRLDLLGYNINSQAMLLN